MKLPWNNGWSCPRDAVWIWELLHVILMHPQNNFPTKLFKPAVWKAKQAMLKPVKLLWKSAMCTALSHRAGWVAAAEGQRIHPSRKAPHWSSWITASRVLPYSYSSDTAARISLWAPLLPACSSLHPTSAFPGLLSSSPVPVFDL